MSLKVHFLHYLVLFIILATGLGFFLSYQHNQTYQFYSIIATVVGYMSWGIVHHKIEDRLSIGVIAEYFLVGALVLTLFSLVLLH